MADNRIDVQRIISLISAMRPTMDTTAIADAVTTWLGNHPEATTTVQDGAITEAKLASALATKIGTITTLSSTVSQQSEDIVNILEAFAGIGLVVYNGQFYINPDGNTLSE